MQLLLQQACGLVRARQHLPCHLSQVSSWTLLVCMIQTQTALHEHSLGFTQLTFGNSRLL